MSRNDQCDCASLEDEAMLQRYQDLLGWPITTSPDGATLRAGDRACATYGAVMILPILSIVGWCSSSLRGSHVV